MQRIDGYREVASSFNEIRVIAAEEAPANLTADLIVTETDTYCALEEENTYRYMEEHPIRVFTAAYNAVPVKPGSVIAGDSAPLPLQAVVYDFDREAICHRDWLPVAWRTILAKADEAGCRCLATPLLGQKESTLSFRQRAELFRSTLTGSGTRIRSIWLQMNAEERRNWHSFVVGSEIRERI